MNGNKLSKPWLTLDRVDTLVGLEPFLIVVGLGILAFLIYKTLLRRMPLHRHRNLKTLFLNFTVHSAIVALLLTFYSLALDSVGSNSMIDRILPYYALLMVLYGLNLFVMVFRIFVFEYLFLKHMNEGVPLLLVNLFSLLLSIFLYGWVLTEVLQIKVLPVLATSAVFTAIVGLALQDTLGNLFAGVALQFDKPFELGDWVEIIVAGQKLTGQIDEISWRATTLISFSEELITIPNKVISQSQVSNFTRRGQAIIKGQIFKVPFQTSIPDLRNALVHAVKGIPGIEKSPEPTVLLLDNTEHGLSVKVIYWIKDYGMQYTIGDIVLERCHLALKSQNLEMGRLRLDIENARTSAPLERP